MFRCSRFHMMTTPVLDLIAASLLLCWKATRRQQSLWNSTTYMHSTAGGEPVSKLFMASIKAQPRLWTVSRQSHEPLPFSSTSTDTSNLPATKNTPMLTTCFATRAATRRGHGTVEVLDTSAVVRFRNTEVGHSVRMRTCVVGNPDRLREEPSHLQACRY